MLFAAWLEQMAQDEEIILEPLRKLNIPTLVKVKEFRILAYREIARELKLTEVVSI